MHTPAFPCGSDSKESACNTGDLGSIPVSGRSTGEGNGNPLQYSGEFYGQRSLAGYNLLSCKELDMTEQLKHTQGQFYIKKISSLASFENTEYLATSHE